MRYEMRRGASGEEGEEEEGDMEEGPSLVGSGIEPQHRGHTAGESSNPIALDIDLNLRPLRHRPRCRPRCHRFSLDPLDPLSGPVENRLGQISSSSSSSSSNLLPGNLVAIADPPVAEPLARMSSLLQDESLEEFGEEQPPLVRNPVRLGPGLDALLQESVTDAVIEARGMAGPFVSRDHFVGGSSLVEMREPLRIFGRILRRMGEELPLSPPRNGEYLLSNTGSPPSRARSRWQWHHMRRSRHDNTDFPASDTTVPTQSDCSSKPEEIADEPDDAPQKSVNFDCNICLETAKDDPIVTLCGHLFCWPCLYQWLYVHSLERKCPVCKALISEKNIIPIYGRGKAEIANNNKDKQKGSLVIPPRPHAPVPSETQERVLSSSGQSSGGLPVNHGMPGDAISNAVSQVLNRLQVAQRLQRQRLEARLQARQRFSGRHIRLSNNSNLNNSGTGLIRDRNPTRLQMPVNVEARISSMDSLLLNFHPLGRLNSGNNPHEILEQVAELNELTNDRESDQASSPSRSCQRGVDTASGSSNADPELLHVRKRRRLN